MFIDLTSSLLLVLMRNVYCRVWYCKCRWGISGLVQHGHEYFKPSLTQIVYVIEMLCRLTLIYVITSVTILLNVSCYCFAAVPKRPMRLQGNHTIAHNTWQGSLHTQVQCKRLMGVHSCFLCNWCIPQFSHSPRPLWTEGVHDMIWVKHVEMTWVCS